MTSVPEVIVIGGGVIGCAVAYELARRSVRVTLLDKTLPGRATSASAGGLWPIGEAIGLGCGVIYQNAPAKAAPSSNGSLAHVLPDFFRDFLVASNARFPRLAAELREATGIDIEYEAGVGLLFPIYDEREEAYVESAVRGLPTATPLVRLSAGEVASLEPRLTPDLRGAVLIPGEHQVNPMLLAEGFKRAAQKHGAVFQPETQVTGLRRQGGRVTGVEVNGRFLPAGTVVNAAGAWAASLAASVGLDLPVFPVRGQIVLTEKLPLVLNGCISTSACYLAQKSHGEVLVGSTTEQEGFDAGVTPDAIRSLCQGAIRAVPMLGRVGVKRVWAGLRPGTPDELPILGPVAGLEGYLNAAGGFRTGIVASPLTGVLIAQLVCGEAASYPIQPFLVDRFSRAAVLTPAY